MTLWLPPSHVVHERKPRFMCTMCEAAWYEESARHEYEHHVLHAHSIEEVRALSPRAQAPGFFDDEWEGGDVEWGAWIKRNAAAGNDPMKYMKTDDGKSGGGVGDG